MADSVHVRGLREKLLLFSRNGVKSQQRPCADEHEPHSEKHAFERRLELLKDEYVLSVAAAVVTIGELKEEAEDTIQALKEEVAAQKLLVTAMTSQQHKPLRKLPHPTNAAADTAREMDRQNGLLRREVAALREVVITAETGRTEADSQRVALSKELVRARKDLALLEQRYVIHQHTWP